MLLDPVIVSYLAAITKVYALCNCSCAAALSLGGHVLLRCFLTKLLFQFGQLLFEVA